MRYERWAGEVTRTIDPLGVVLKGGVWYVVVRSSGQLRTYRASRILALEVLDERFERPADFDLAAYWQTWTEEFEANLHRDEVEIRISPHGLELMHILFNPVAAQAATDSAGIPDHEGWLRMTLPVESLKHAHVNLLRLGADVEVLSPPELRERMAETAEALVEMYAVRDQAEANATPTP